MRAREKERTPLTQARSKRQKCARCQKAASTMLHWRAFDYGIIGWPDVCEKCWQECQNIVRAMELAMAKIW